jgi:cell division protein FtsQ
MFSRVLVSLTLMSILVLCAGVWRVLDAPLRGFVIDGELSVAERTELQDVLQTVPLQGVLSTSLATVTAAVTSLPWAREISVRRAWPDRLQVTLHKAAPVARWGDDKYLSAFGDLLSLPDEYVGLPRFDIAVATPEAAMEVYRLLDQIAAREQLGISELHQNNQGEWRVLLARGPEVVLGAEQLNERMHRFLLLHRRVLARAAQPAAYVDVRYANGLAVRYHDPAPAANEQTARLLARNDESRLSKGKSNGG